MMKYFLIFFLFVGLYSCRQQTPVKRHIPDPRAKKLLDSAEVLINEQQQYEKAVPLLNQAIKIDSNYTAPYVYKLSYQWQMKQYDSCLKITDQLIRLHPAVADYYAQTGMLYYLKGDSSASKKFFEQAVSLCEQRLDTMSKKNNQYDFTLLNEGIYLVFSSRQNEANKIFINLSKRQTDKVFKSEDAAQTDKQLRDWFASFANKSKEEILDKLEKPFYSSGESVGQLKKDYHR